MTPLRTLLLAVIALPLQAQVPADAVVRVQLLGRTALSDVRVEAVGFPLVVVADGAEAGALAVGQGVTLSRSGGAVRVSGPGLDVTAADVALRGEGFRFEAGRTARRYAGSLAAYVDGGRLRVVNHVALEPYVASVVASELGFDVAEAQKAQAVLARTYAARRLGAPGRFDLDDHTGSQVYHGEGTVTAASRAAALATAGEVLTYQGDLAQAFYFSSSGGHTADNEVAWSGAPIPYLRGVQDPYDQGAPDHTWATDAPRADVLAALSARFGGDVRAFTVGRRSRSGRVLEVRLDGADRPTVTGAEFRSAVNARLGWRTVRSAKFDAAVRGDAYAFSGGGFGHGVGMSQYGAIGQARAGRSYRQILGHYFAGTDVSAPNTSAAPAEPVPVLVVRVEPAVRAGDPAAEPAVRRRLVPRRVVREPSTAGAAVAQTEAPAAPATRRTAW